MATTNTTSTHRHVGDGTATPYAVDFPIYEAGDIVITEVLILLGTERTLVVGVDYSLSITTGVSFTVTPLAAIGSSNKHWVTVRAIPNTQTTNLVDQNAFPPESVETQFDKLTLQIQDLKAIVERCLIAPIGDPVGLSLATGTSLARAGLYPKWDASGNLTAVALDSTSTLTASTFGQTVMDALTAEAALNLHGISRGPIAGRDSASAVGANGIHFATDTLAISISDGVSWEDVVTLSEASPNLLPNGEFLVNQRGGYSVATTAASAPHINNDGSYVFDQQVLLSDGSDIVDISRETSDVPSGFTVACKATVQTPNKKFGYLFPLSNQESGPLLGGSEVASVSFYAKSTQLTKIRAVVLSWDDTADAATADVVNAWGATGVNPTYVNPGNGWTAENTAIDNTISSSWSRHTISNIAIDTASTNNVALFVYYCETDASVSDDLFVTGVKMNEGATAAVYDHRSFGISLIDCMRFFQTSFDEGTRITDNPGTSVGAAGYVATHTATLVGGVYVRLPVPLIATGYGINAYNTNATGSGFRNITAGSSTGNAVGTSNGRGGFHLHHAAAAVTAADLMRIHWAVAAVITV